MKTKLIPNLLMKLKKSIYVSGPLLAGIIVCMSVFFGLREHKERELQGKSNFTFQNNGIAASLTAPRGNPEEELLTPEERIVQRAKNNFMSLYSEDELATPEKQKMLEVMNSPEYLEYIENFREKGYRFRQSAEFWESHGFPLDRQVFKDAFRKNFPTGEPEDYEPEMRLKMAKLFLSTEQVDLTDLMKAHLQRQEVFLKFIREDYRNIGWLSGQFGIDHDGGMLAGWEEGAESNLAFVWMTDVQRNATSIVAAAEAAGIDTPKVQQASASSWDMSSVMENPSVSADATTGESPSISPPATDALSSSVITNPETGAVSTPAPDLPDVPKAPTNFPTVEGLRSESFQLEASLKEQFSPERFERAMDTLDRYGTEEGLRRLRENDPEVASQIEQHRNRSRSEDSDKSEEEDSK